MPKKNRQVMVDKADQRFMAAAIRLAKRHIGQTCENPSVGAIIVGNDGSTIVGHGVTATGGRPHAETQALLMAGDKAKGGTAYVTLEPCSHYGKTPPCAKALIDAAVKRVVIALADPDERVSGRGVKMLENAGIIVETGVLADYAYEGLSAYLATRRFSRPEVTVKMAISADNGIGIAGKRGVAISNELSHAVSHGMRAEHQAIMVGSRTVIADDPDLTCRLPGLENRSPIRIVIDPKLSTPVGCRLVQTAHIVPTWVITKKGAEAHKKANLGRLGVRVFEIDCDENVLKPKDILKLVFENNVASVLLEGGTATATSFLENEAVDKIVLFRSKIILGDNRIAAPDFKKYLANFSRINEAKFGKDSYSEWRRRFKCLPE